MQKRNIMSKSTRAYKSELQSALFYTLYILIEKGKKGNVTPAMFLLKMHHNKRSWIQNEKEICNRDWWWRIFLFDAKYGKTVNTLFGSRVDFKRKVSSKGTVRNCFSEVSLWRTGDKKSRERKAEKERGTEACLNTERTKRECPVCLCMCVCVSISRRRKSWYKQTALRLCNDSISTTWTHNE